MKLSINRNYIPLLATAAIFLLLFGMGSAMYKGFFSLRVVTNLLSDNAFLGICAIGMTFVILSGGIDLSVGSVLGFTTILLATLIGDHHIHPVVAAVIVLAVGTGFGLGMGSLIHLYGLPAFLVTLGGMFFARGMAFVVSMESVAIDHSFYGPIQDFTIPVGGSAGVQATTLIFLALFAFAIYVLHFTLFGRYVYALGGNEQSAILMGLPVARTKIAVYGFNGFCSALAGIVATVYMGSGNPVMGTGLELDAIASVVIGGTLLTGGVGYVAGTLLGVLIYGTIQTILMFDGRLNSWWLRISIGALLLMFILLQRLLSRKSSRQCA